MHLLSCFGIFNVPSSLLVGGLFSTSKCRAAFASENNVGRCRCNFFSMQLLCLRRLSKSVFCFFSLTAAIYPARRMQASVVSRPSRLFPSMWSCGFCCLKCCVLLSGRALRILEPTNLFMQSQSALLWRLGELGLCRKAECSTLILHGKECSFDISLFFSFNPTNQYASPRSGKDGRCFQTGSGPILFQIK